MAMVTGRIDVHFHAIPEFWREAAAAAGRRPAVSSGLPAWSPELALGLMDRYGIATAITSISAPGVHFGDDAAARDLARRCNEYAAQCARERPGRFGAFAVLPLPDIEGALAEIAYALDVLGLDGIGLFTNYDNRYLGDLLFDPVLAMLHERRAVTFVHPVLAPATRGLMLDLPAFVVEYPFDTTRAATNLIYSGAIDRFSGIRFILSHAGGTLPYLAFRVAHSTLIDPVKLGRLSPAEVTERIRTFYFDTALSPDIAVMEALRSCADPAQILFGSDWPYAPETVTAATVAALDAPRLLSGDERAAIANENARLLFPRLRAAVAR